ncbi:MAG: Molybdopterin dehydrogenase, FAD-binding [Herbaspirillum sp.]|nr:Molybdopterin dehydrogenase, FAD-binding [Herbaspirillum sp.]
MKAARFEYAQPATCAEAAALLHDSAGMGKVLGGGQSLGPMMNLRLAQPELLVDVRAIAALRECTFASDAITLGAATTHAAIEDGCITTQTLDQTGNQTGGLMSYVASGIAYRAVRNRGTLGGSLAHADPAADWVNLMALLDAQYLLQGPGGSRTVGNADWMSGAFTTALQEDEILTAVRIPALSPSARWSYYKFNRKTGEFAEAIAAFVDDPQRGVRRGLIGATDGTPYVIADAAPLLDGWDGAFADAQLQAAGLRPHTYEYRIHAVALARAAAGISKGESA